MRLFELNDISLHDRLVRLINDPNTDPNTKKIAQIKLSKLNSSEIKRIKKDKSPTNQEQAITYSITSFGHSKKITDTNRPFIIKNQTVIMYNQFDQLLSKIKASFIKFDDGTTDDPRPSIQIVTNFSSNSILDIIEEFLKSNEIPTSKVEKNSENTYKFYIL